MHNNIMSTILIDVIFKKIDLIIQKGVAAKLVVYFLTGKKLIIFKCNYLFLYT